MKENRSVKLLLALFVALSCFRTAYSQNEANIWWFGTKAGLDFNTSPPSVITGLPINTYEGSATISDPATGELIFATDGQTVWYPDETVVPGGTGLRGASSATQSALIVPFSNDPDKWYIFTSNVDPGTGTPQGTNYYVVTRTGTALSVGAATNLAASTASTEHLCALGDGTGGYWLVTHATNSGGGTNQFLAWHIDNTGALVSTTPTTSSAGNLMNNYQGTMKANTCQNKIGVTYLNDGVVEVYNFDNTTGQVTGVLYSSSGYTQPYGLEFSPNDDYMYFGTLSGSCYQMNMATGVVTNTGWLPPNNGPNKFGQMQLGPDGKIYISNESTSGSNVYLGVINNPNNVYTAANYNRQGVLLSTSGGIDALPQLGMPTFSRTFVSAVTEPLVNGVGVSGTGVYCVNTNINFSFNFSGSINSSTILWNFGDGNTSTSASPVHSYSTTGIKNVTLEFEDECGRLYTRNFDVDIQAPKVPAGIITCGATSITLTGTGTPSSDYPNYVWYDAASGGNILGVGSPVTLNYGDVTNAPGSVWVEVASAVSVTSSGTNQSIGSAASSFGWVGNLPSGAGYSVTGIDVLADVLTLESFDVRPYNFGGANCNGFTFDVEIRDGSSALVFSKSYTAPNPFTCGNVFTVAVNTELIQGNDYSITVRNASGNIQYLYGGSWAGGTNANAIAYPFQGNGTCSIGNLVYDYKNFSVTSTCSQRVQVNRTCTLPVELSYFEAVRQGQNVLLSWATSMEQDNAYFVIERSVDGQSFQAIGQVNGNGNSSENLSYSFTDYESLPGTSYYRLVQYDIDGKRHNGPVRVVQGLGGENDILLYPNPSAQQFNIILSGSVQGSVLSVTDVLGREVFRKAPGTEETRLTLGNDWQTGHYILQWVFDGGTKTVHLIKK